MRQALLILTLVYILPPLVRVELPSGQIKENYDSIVKNEYIKTSFGVRKVSQTVYYLNTGINKIYFYKSDSILHHTQTYYKGKLLESIESFNTYGKVRYNYFYDEFGNAIKIELRINDSIIGKRCFVNKYDQENRLIYVEENLANNGAECGEIKSIISYNYLLNQDTLIEVKKIIKKDTNTLFRFYFKESLIKEISSKGNVISKWQYDNHGRLISYHPNIYEKEEFRFRNGKKVKIVCYRRKSSNDPYKITSASNISYYTNDSIKSITTRSKNEKVIKLFVYSYY